MKKDEVGIVSYKNYLTNMSYDLKDKWCQIVYLTGKELLAFKYLSAMEKHKHKYGFETINEVCEMGGKFKVYRPNKHLITDVDTYKDLERANQIL